MSTKAKAAKFGALGFLAIALGCAALAAMLVGNMMKSKYTGTRVVPVVVAKQALPAGTPVSAAVLELREWPEDAVPQGAFHSVAALVEANKGATTTVGVLAGEPMVKTRLSGSRQGTGIASLIRPNMRAFAIKVDDSVGYTNLVYPGATVDIIATIRDPMGRGPSSRIAVQNARVLSVGKDSDVATRQIQQAKADKLTGAQNNGGTFITLEVTPKESEILSIARNEGTIDVVLRNASDDQIVDTKGATPVKFSAFAADAVEENTPADPNAKKVTAKRSRVKVRRRNRRIQLVASDADDKPKPRRSSSSSGKIETYNAQ